MNHFPDHDHGVDAYDMPCVQALIAGTLALMTGHAQSACAGQRALMAAKTASNLCLLAQHPVVSPDFKSVVLRLRGKWVEQVQAERACGVSVQPGEAFAATEAVRALWHRAAEGLQ